MFRASAVAGLHSWGPSLMVYWSCAAVSAVYVWSHSKMKPGQGPMGLAKGLVQQSTSSEVASVALAVLHGLSIVPLVLLPIMQDVHLKLGIVLNCTLLLCLMAGSLVFHWMGIVKVCCPSPPPQHAPGLSPACRSWPAQGHAYHSRVGVAKPMCLLGLCTHNRCCPRCWTPSCWLCTPVWCPWRTCRQAGFSTGSTCTITAHLLCLHG